MRILIPVDGSLFSQKAIEFVVARQAAMDETLEVELLHVVEEFPVGMVSRFELDNYMEVHSREVFDALRPLYADTALKVHEEVRDGHAGQIIYEESKAFGADLIVMGCRGHTPMHGYFLGSVSRRVLAQTVLPVVLVGENAIRTGDVFRVGLAVDASEYSAAMVKALVKLKAFMGKRFEVFVLSAVDAAPDFNFNRAVTEEVAEMAKLLMPYYERKQVEEFEANTKHIWPMLEAKGIEVKPVCLKGDASEEVVKFANDNLDMLMVGSHGTGHFMAAVLGSTALHIASAVTLPLMVVQAITLED